MNLKLLFWSILIISSIQLYGQTPSSDYLEDIQTLRTLNELIPKIENDSVFIETEYLIKNLNDINIIDGYEETALHIVCKRNKRYLVEINAYVDSIKLYPEKTNYYRQRAEDFRKRIESDKYVYARNNSISDTFNLRRFQLVKLLLDRNANPNTYKGALKGPPIYYVENEVIFDLLIENGADINAPYEFVHPFLIVSSFERVNKFIQLGFDFNAKHGSSNEFRAAFLNNLDSITLALLIKNDPKKAGEYDDIGWNIIHYAASGIRADLLNAIIASGLDTSLKTKSENEGYYGYDNEIPIGSTAVEIIELLYNEYKYKIGEKETELLIVRLKKMDNNSYE